MLASLLRIILLTATLKILERGLDKGPIIYFSSSADKNHNPRKGTETVILIPPLVAKYGDDKNHNPRKGTETACDRAAFLQVCGRDKNHNPRKGTET